MAKKETQEGENPFSKNPFLNKNVNEKDYAKGNVRIVNNGSVIEIPEQVMPVEVIDMNNPSKEADKIFDDYVDEDDETPKAPKFAKSAKNNDAGKKQKFSKVEDGIISNDEDFTSPKAKKKGAEAFAGMILTAYSFIMQMTAKYLSMDEQNVIDIATKEGLPLDIVNFPIDLGDGETMTFKKYIDDYNEGIEMSFDCEDEEWRDEMMENLTAICIEKGLALTPMQSLIFKGLEKPVKGIISAIVGKTQLKKMLQSMGEMFRGMNAQQQNDVIAQMPTATVEDAETSSERIKAEIDKEYHNAEVIEAPVLSKSDKRVKKKEIENVSEGHEPEENEFDMTQTELE